MLRDGFLQAAYGLDHTMVLVQRRIELRTIDKFLRLDFVRAVLSDSANMTDSSLAGQTLIAKHGCLSQTNLPQEVLDLDGDYLFRQLSGCCRHCYSFDVRNQPECLVMPSFYDI